MTSIVPVSERSVVCGVLVCSFTAGAVSLAGCQKREPEREYQTITGYALSIDEASGKVAMRFYSKKKQLEVELVGTVTAETEVLIDGRVAQLSEIKVGEEVVVTGYREKDGERRRLVATRIEVERGEWRRGPTSATQAATKPGTRPASKPGSR